MKKFHTALLASILTLSMTIYAIEPQEIGLNRQSLSQKEEEIDDETAHKMLRLTENDYREVAQRLGVEVAAIKAVVDVEAGRQHEGFYKPQHPIINFDLTMFRQFARKNRVTLSHYTRSHSEVFSRPNIRRYGSQQAAQHARLHQAMSIDEVTAIQGTFWGMFQLGGFNWKLCGCKDINEFVERMSRSERDQLELFANFIINTGLQDKLKARNWAAFARIYNGPAYAARGYHRKLAAAYARHKK